METTNTYSKYTDKGSFLLSSERPDVFRILFNSLKKLTNIITLYISKDKIIIRGTNENIFIHGNLDPDRFEISELNDNVKLNINLVSFCNLLKNCSYKKGVNVTCFKKEESDGFWTFKMQTENNNSFEKYDIDLIEREEYFEPIINPVIFDYELTLDTKYYSELIKKTKHFDTDRMSITVSDSSVLFYCENDEMSGQFQYGNSDIASNLEDNLKYEFKEYFSYSDLVKIQGFTSLCNIFYIYIKKDFPICFRFQCADLGDIKFCLSPLNKNTFDSLFNDNKKLNEELNKD